MAEKWHQLISLRKAAGLSQFELARRLDMGRSALGNYEQGDREPDFETVRKIADFFKVSVDYLLGRQPDEGKTPQEIPPDWRQMIRLAQAEGYNPDQVLSALRLLASIRKQQEQKEEREG